MPMRRPTPRACPSFSHPAPSRPPALPRGRSAHAPATAELKSRYGVHHPAANPSGVRPDCRRYAASVPDDMKLPSPLRNVTTCAPLASAAASQAPKVRCTGAASPTSNVFTRWSRHTCVPSAPFSPRARAARSWLSSTALALNALQCQLQF
eukprot:5548055-Prymnesium_polylepis.1